MPRVFKFWEYETQDEHNSRETSTFLDLANKFLNNEAADDLYDIGSRALDQGQSLWSQAAATASNAASTVGDAASSAWAASAPAAWRPGSDEYQGYEAEQARLRQGGPLNQVTAGLSEANQFMSGASGLLMGDALSVGGRFVGELVGVPNVGEIVPSARNVPVIGEDLAEASPAAILANVVPLPGKAGKLVDAASGIMPAARGAVEKIAAPSVKRIAQYAEHIATQTAANQGETFNLARAAAGDVASASMGGQPTYAVSMFPDHTKTVEGLPSAEDVADFIANGTNSEGTVRNLDLLRDPRLSVGTWFDQDSGQTYIDISATLPDRKMAEAVGRRHNQKAIFDLGSFDEIPTGGSGEMGAFDSLPSDMRLPDAVHASKFANPVEQPPVYPSGTPEAVVNDAMRASAASSPDGIAHLTGAELEALPGSPFSSSIAKSSATAQVKTRPGGMPDMDEIREAYRLGVPHKDWYVDFGEQAARIVGPENLPEFFTIFGVTSAQTKVHENVEATLKIMRFVREQSSAGKTWPEIKEMILDPGVRDVPVIDKKTGQQKLDKKTGKPLFDYSRPPTLQFPMAAGDKRDAIVRGYETGVSEVKSGAKTSSYAGNLESAGQRVFDPRTTNDMWMWRLAGVPDDLSEKAAANNDNAYRFLEAILNEVGRENGVPGHMVQAATWATMKNLSEQAPQLVEAVRGGQMSLGQALVEARRINPDFFNTPTGGLSAFEAPRTAQEIQLGQGILQTPGPAMAGQMTRSFPGKGQKFMGQVPEQRPSDLGFRIQQRTLEEGRAPIAAIELSRDELATAGWEEATETFPWLTVPHRARISAGRAMIHLPGGNSRLADYVGAELGNAVGRPMTRVAPRADATEVAGARINASPEQIQALSDALEGAGIPHVVGTTRGVIQIPHLDGDAEEFVGRISAVTQQAGVTPEAVGWYNGEVRLASNADYSGDLGTLRDVYSAAGRSDLQRRSLGDLERSVGRAAEPGASAASEAEFGIRSGPAALGDAPLPDTGLGAIKPGAQVTDTSARLAREAAAAPARSPGQPIDDAMAIFREIPRGEAIRRTRGFDADPPTRGSARQVDAEDLAPGGGSATEVTPADPPVPTRDLGSATEVNAEDIMPGGGSARNVTPRSAGQATNIPAFSVRSYTGQPTATMGAQRPTTRHPKGTALNKLEGAIQWDATEQPRGSLKQGVTNVIRQLFDNTVDVRHISEQYQRVMGRPLTTAENAWKLLRLSRGSEAAAEQFRVQHLKPAVEGLDEVGQRNLNLILKAHDAIDKQKAIDAELDQKLIARIARKTGGPADPLLLKLKDHQPLIQRSRELANHNFSGLKAGDAETALKELEAEVGADAWADLMGRAEKVWDMGHRLLQYKAAHGLVEPKLAADLIRDYPHYSPIRIVEWLEDQGKQAGGMGRSLSVRTNDLARLTLGGTDKKALPPLDAYVSAVSSAHALGMRNDAARQMIRYFRDDPELATLIRPANKDAVAFVESMRGDKIGKRVPGETTFTVYEDGVPLEFYVDKQLKQAFEISGPNWLETWPTIIREPLRVSADMLRAGATGANILFMLPNALGDAMTYLVRGGGLPSLPKNAAYLARGYKSSFLKDADYQKMIGAGGGQSGFFGAEGPFRKAQLKGYVGRINTADQLFGALGDLATFKPIKELGGRFEEATRMAEFHRMTAAGADAQTAALGARDVSIDFARGGLLTKALNGLVPFFNVGFQAPAQVVRALKDEGTRPKALMGLMTMVVAPTVLTEMYNRQYGEEYQDVPQYLKDRGLVFMLPSEGNVDPETGRTIPRFMFLNLREWSPFAVAIREGMGRMLGDDPRTWQDAAMAVLRNASPIEPSQGVGGALMDMAPPLARTSIELATNHDFFRDRSIVPDGLKNLPADQQYTSQTSETAKQIGKLTGTSPMKLEHGIRGLGAGVAGQALAAGDVALKAAGVAETPDRGLARIERELAKTGLNPEQKAKLQTERDRLLSAKENRESLVREQPIVGGIANAAGFREQGGELERRASTKNAEAIKAAKGSELGKELERLGLAMPDVSDKVEGVYLDRRNREVYRTRATGYRQELLGALVESDVYLRASDADKTRLARGAMSRAADWAAQTVAPGEVKGGREFLSRRIGGDIDKAIPTYLRAIEADQELRGMRSRRFIGIGDQDVDQIVADQSLLTQYRSALGKSQGDMLFMSRFGPERYARLRMLKVSPLYDIQVRQTKAKYPEYTTIFSPDADEARSMISG